MTRARTLALKAARRAVHLLDAVPAVPAGPDRRDFDEAFLKLVEQVRPFTMTSPERLYAVREAVRYVVTNDIPGVFVECGVWKGGSSMMAALTLLELGCRDRELYLFDTFEGMTQWSERDVDWKGNAAEDVMPGADKLSSRLWAFAGEEEVVANLASTGYPRELMRLVRGKVEDTLPERAPDDIAILRLDTDWYESTKHELEHLAPRVVDHGVLIVDDYGHWQGSREAVDEWLAGQPFPVLLHRSDYTGRTAVLPPRRPVG